MVQNGYILNVSTEKLPEFLKKVREDLKEIVREGVLSLVAKSAERLYDMKFVEGLKYETSIFDQAVGMVSGKISGRCTRRISRRSVRFPCKSDYRKAKG